MKAHLVSGEEVTIDLERVTYQDQVLVRAGERTIIGVPSKKPGSTPGVYIWHETEGVYKYSGDVLFHEEKDGAVGWTIVFGPVRNQELAERDAHHLEFVAENLSEHPQGSVVIHLSKVPQ